MRTLITLLLMSFLPAGGFAQSLNLIPNYSFESGTAQKPDDRAQLGDYCSNWLSIGSADWHTTQSFGSNNWDQQRTRGASLGTGGAGGPGCGGCPLQDPFRGNYMAAIGNCEGIYLELDAQTFDFEPGCTFSLSFRVAARNFYTSQQSRPWYNQMDVLFYSEEPFIPADIDPEYLVCLENFDGTVEHKISHQFERGYNNGVVVDDFVPGQWLELTFNNLIWNESYQYMAIRMALEGQLIPQNYGWYSGNYYYIDDVQLTRGFQGLEPYTVIDQADEDNEALYRYCEYIQVADPGISYEPVFTGTQELIAGKYIEVVPTSLFQPASPENSILLEIDPCLSCNDVYDAGFNLCLCNASEDPCEVVLATPEFSLNPPVPIIPGYSYEWSSPDPIMDAGIANPNSAVANVALPAGQTFPFCETHHYFLFELREYDEDQQLVNIYPLEILAYNECTASEYLELNPGSSWPPEECGDSPGKRLLSGSGGEERQLNIYPNPAHDALTMSFAEKGDYQLRLYSATGQLVQTVRVKDSDTYKLERKALDAGLYFLSVQHSSGLLHKYPVIFTE